jgi:hypothetical protein
MKNFSLILCFILACITPITSVVKNIQFDQNCSGYLKQAADANTPELALDCLNKALVYVEKNHLTYGYTSVFYKTEDENVEFWYSNLKACQKELKACLNGIQLEKSNVLMKVRESLTDEGKNGTELTIPSGISRYPNNFPFAILNVLSTIVLGCIIGGAWLKFVD